MFTEYRVEKSFDRGLWRLTETIVTSKGSRITGMTAFFETREQALVLARSLSRKGDTLFCEEDSI